MSNPTELPALPEPPAQADPDPDADPDALAGKRQFPCTQCGASLVFAPGTTHLVCPYCAQSNAIPADDAQIHELDYRDFLGRLADNAETDLVATVSCGGCAAQISSPGGATAFDCPFCGHAINTQARSRRLIRPRSLLAFSVTREQARAAFKQWLKSRWFLPTRLARYGQQSDRLAGVYLPYWTYDSDTHSHYRGQRGDHYWVTEYYTVRENGKSVRKSRRVRKTRWHSVGGRVSVAFDDVLVLASQALPDKLTHKLEPWDFSGLVPFDEAYLAGFRAEVYRVDLAEGFGHARAIMDPVIRDHVRRDIGGDEQRIDHVDTQHHRVTFKHLLLPVWSSAYRWRNQVYRFVINGQSGEVQGQRPYSVWKILFLVAGILAAVAAGVAVYHQMSR